MAGLRLPRGSGTAGPRPKARSVARVPSRPPVSGSCWVRERPSRKRAYATRRRPVGEVRPLSQDRTVAGVMPKAAAS